MKSFGLGQYSVILKADDDAVLISSLLSLESAGNVRTIALKVFKYGEKRLK